MRRKKAGDICPVFFDLTRRKGFQAVRDFGGIMNNAADIEGLYHLIPGIQVIDHNRQSVLQICRYFSGGHSDIFKIVPGHRIVLQMPVKGEPQINFMKNSGKVFEIELRIGRT